jgi:SHS2 domain-containing protein
VSLDNYRFLPHTADAKFQAFGDTLEESFTNAALATASLMWDWTKIEKKTEHRVQVEGRDLKQLLVSLLEEIIYLLESKMFLLADVDAIRIKKKQKKYSLTALFKGDRYSEKYTIFGDVKAITYNEMVIEQEDRIMVQVVVDI